MDLKIGTNTKIGILVVVTIGVVFWGVNFLKGTDILNNDQTFYVLYDKVEGLSPANPVNLRGLKVGQVNEIFFSDESFKSITIEITVSNEIRIPKGTIAKIQSSDILGTKEIDIELGTSHFYLESGDTLIADIEKGIQEQIRLEMVPVKKKAIELMGSMDSITSVLTSVFDKNTVDNLRTSIGSISKTFKNLESSSRSIDTIVSPNASLATSLRNIESVTRNISNKNEKIGNIIDNLNSITDSVATYEIKSIISEINKSVTELAAISNKLNSGEGALGMLINDKSSLEKLNKLSQSLDSLVNDPHVYHHIILGKKDKKK